MICGLINASIDPTLTLFLSVWLCKRYIMRKSNFLFSCFLVLSLIQCSSAPFEQEALIWMSAPVYICCNAWDNEGDSEDKIESKVQSLFLTENLLVFENDLDDSGQLVLCGHCCHCPTEFTIKVRIFARGEEQATQWGFSVID